MSEKIKGILMYGNRLFQNMSERNKQILKYVGGGMLLTILLRIIFPMETIHIEVAAEEIASLGGLSFTNSMFVTIIVDVILIMLAVLGTASMKLVPRGLQNVMEAIIEALYNLFKGINAEHVGRVFPIVATIFLFVLVSNLLGLLPGFGSFGPCAPAHAEGEEEHGSAGLRVALKVPEGINGILPALPLFGQGSAEAEPKSEYLFCKPGDELIPLFRAPTTDLNNTLALALVAVVLVEYMGFRVLGRAYLRKFFIDPRKEGAIMTAVGILELISEIARLPAFMFRLFGNVFAGEVLIIVLIFLLPLFLPVPFYLFEVFVAFIQAFIFAVLTMAFISIAVTSHSSEHH